MKKEFLANSFLETQKIGRDLALEILNFGPRKSSFIMGLFGDLGGGKTTFLQGFADGLGIKEKILSPTFVILKKFQIPINVGCTDIRKSCCVSKFQNFYHIDCYRIQKSKEILDLGFKEIMANPKNIIAIEWAEKIKDLLPKNAMILNFEFINRTKRKIIIKQNEQ